jgi:hypothetical protein
MRAVSEARAVLRTSAAVLALVWFGQAAMAEDAVLEDPAVSGVDALDGFLGPAETGETVIDAEESACGGCEAWTTFVTDVEGGGEEVIVEDETVLMDGGEEVIVEDDSVLVDAGGEGDGEFVTTCDGCELQNMAGEPPVLSPGGPEVQRDSAVNPLATTGNGSDSDPVVSRSSGNACDSGPVSKMWICTVQGDSWRN